MDTFISEIDASGVATNVLISVQTAIRIIQNKLCTLDQNQSVRDLNGDRRNINGKILRTYRHKTSVQTEHCNIMSASTNHQTYNGVILECDTTISCGDRKIFQSANPSK